MKISVRWIFDHIKGLFDTVAIEQLVDLFIKTTAEIEGWKKLSLDLHHLTLAQLISVKHDTVTLHSPEWNSKLELPMRSDYKQDAWYLVEKKDNGYVWATLATLGGTKDVLLPYFDEDESCRSGGWKKSIELDDYILEIDNKSINHRPDLWGHRGIAREIAAIFNMPLRPLSEFIIKKDVVSFDKRSQADKNNLFSTSIDASDVCKRFATLHIEKIDNKPSKIAMAVRLSRLDSRPINLYVDLTNYVMLDLGQPMHAFDAAKIEEKKITVRRAVAKEKITLLDGEIVELTSDDIVIADGKGALSLAGVMGGAASGISFTTSSVVLESANFDATTIRLTSARHKKRTESSMRFEKSLDPEQNADAIMRFLWLLDRENSAYISDKAITSLGSMMQRTKVTVAHDFIESRLGLKIGAEKVKTIMDRLGFELAIEKNDYVVSIPSYRATKDINIAEDIVEEVGRFIGYDTIEKVMPAIQIKPIQLSKTFRLREIKNLLSYGLLMREICGYSFFDESFLRELSWSPTDYLIIKNPVSENYTRLVTTLQPNLFKAVQENSDGASKLAFYEWGRVWCIKNGNPHEQRTLSGIFFDAGVGIDFYTGKELLNQLFSHLNLSIVWQKDESEYSAWYAHQVATIMHENVVIGTAGMMNEQFIRLVAPTGGAFTFELNGDYLLDHKQPLRQCKQLSKYPPVKRDISMLVPISSTAAELEQSIKAVDKRIEKVVLIDFFSKPDWKEQKSVTFSVEIIDYEKTLVHDEIEKLLTAIVTQLQEQGAVIR